MSSENLNDYNLDDIENFLNEVDSAGCKKLNENCMKTTSSRIQPDAVILKELEDLCEEELEATKSCFDEKAEKPMQDCKHETSTTAVLRERHSTMATLTESDLSDLTDDDLSYDEDENDNAIRRINSDSKTIDCDSTDHSCVVEYVWAKKDAVNQDSWGTVIPNDIKYHKQFSNTCTKLCNFNAISPEASQESSADDSNEGECRTITAKELLPQLDSCFVYMGGRDLNGAQIICFPHCSTFRDVTEENIFDAVLYMTSLLRKPYEYDGFVLLIDRRRDKWTPLPRRIVNLISKFPGNLKTVLVLRSAAFLPRKALDMGFRFRREQLSTKVPMVMLSTTYELLKYVTPDQLPVEFGGNFIYDHKTWLRNRMLIEDFTSHAIEIGKNLEAFGFELENTELPFDVFSTQHLIQAQKTSAKRHKNKIDGLLETAITLKCTINISCSGFSTVSGNYCLEVETLKRAISTIEEVDATFSNCWMKHEEKLNQCLELRQFEQDFAEASSKLTIYQQWCDQQSGHVGTSSSWVEYLINEAERMKENFMESSVEFSLLSTIGNGMLEANYYVSDYLRSKCSELENMLTDLHEAFNKRVDFLTEVRTILLKIEDLNSWCDKAMSLLAGQGIEKVQSLEGAQQAIDELEEFFCEDPNRGTVTDELIPQTLKNYKNAVNSRYEEAVDLFEKRRAYFNKTITRCNERPVQRVEPSIKIDQANIPLTGERIQVLGPTNQVPDSNFDPQVRLRHVMNELLSTEDVYVKELNGILQGYGQAIDDDYNVELVPEELKGQKDVLLGNMEEIYSFHSKVFQNDLEEYRNTPALVGSCFIKRKENFEIYAKYCQNSSRSEELRTRIGEQHPFFVTCQRKLGHVLPLGAYLLKPIQRITKYQLLLKEILKCGGEHASEIRTALDTMLLVLKSVNDSMHKAAIVGYSGEVDHLGCLLLQGPFSVHLDHKKTRVKNLARNRFNKTSHRHLFLFEKELLFCKLQNADSENNSSYPGHIAATSSGMKKQCYFFKHSLKMSEIEISEKMRHDAKKLEILHQGRDIYTLLAVSESVKQEWANEMKKIAAKYPKEVIKINDQKIADKKKAAKARRRKRSTKKSRSAVIERKPEIEDRPSLRRSSSMGKEKLFSTNMTTDVRVRGRQSTSQMRLSHPILKSRRSLSLSGLNNSPLGSPTHGN